MNREQAEQREQLRAYMSKRMDEHIRAHREVKLPIGFHMNGIPIYADEENDDGSGIPFPA